MFTEGLYTLHVDICLTETKAGVRRPIRVYQQVNGVSFINNISIAEPYGRTRD